MSLELLTPLSIRPPTILDDRVWFTAKMNSNFALNHQEARFYGTKKTESGTKISDMPILEISAFLRGFLLKSYDFRKICKFWQLERNGF